MVGGPRFLSRIKSREVHIELPTLDYRAFTLQDWTDLFMAEFFWKTYIAKENPEDIPNIIRGAIGNIESKKDFSTQHYIKIMSAAKKDLDTAYGPMPFFNDVSLRKLKLAKDSWHGKYFPDFKRYVLTSDRLSNIFSIVSFLGEKDAPIIPVPSELPVSTVATAPAPQTTEAAPPKNAPNAPAQGSGRRGRSFHILREKTPEELMLEKARKDIPETRKKQVDFICSKTNLGESHVLVGLERLAERRLVGTNPEGYYFLTLSRQVALAFLIDEAKKQI